LNTTTLTYSFRNDINYKPNTKILSENNRNNYKIYIFAQSIVNQLTMYINTNQLITNKAKKNDKH